ncbi:MAG: cyclic nucleotide-binding domain-containing protein, partial [Pyrinomonadaceae bacterium]
MIANTSETPAANSRAALPVLAHQVKEAGDAAWVQVLRWVALVVFLAVPVFCLLVPNLAGRVVWTVVVASLPLFIVLVGYHRWRVICPLAFVGQLASKFGHPGRRKMSKHWEIAYYYISGGIFFVSLWLRLIATNGDGTMLATFFIAISFAALVAGVLFTGKTWCNYLCPLSFIEKIYTEPHGLRDTGNSQCEKCTACKKSCPDINEENGYWKEIEARPKRFVYYAFPGLVFAFYFYYFMQAGTWDYYFGGSWTNQPGVIKTAFFPGHDALTAGFYFFPAMPRAVAAALTLGALAFASFVLFSFIERLVGRLLQRRNPPADAATVRHATFTIAAFTAFVTFYTFAGQPTLRKLPEAVPHVFLVLVVLTATMFFLRRWRRSSAEFTEETLARNIIKRWKWTDVQPKNLREAFLINQIRTQDSVKDAAHVLEVYKDAIFEALADGFVTRDEVQMLESLRGQLNISAADHEKVMNALAEQDRTLFSDPSKQLTAEKRLQLESYTKALAEYFGDDPTTGEPPDEKLINRLRAEYRVTRSEHETILDRLLGDTEGLAARLAQEIERIESAALTILVLERSKTPTHELLCDLLRRMRGRAIDRLLSGLSYPESEAEASDRLRDSFSSNDAASRESAVEDLREWVAPAVADRILAVYQAISLQATIPTLVSLLRVSLDGLDSYVRAVALYALYEKGAANLELLESRSKDENELVRATAQGLADRSRRHAAGDSEPGPLLVVEKMIALRAAPIFAGLTPEGLLELARASTEEFYAAGAELCVEGSEGREVFILLSGKVRIFKGTGAARHQVATETIGGLIGEMAVLDPSPRSATVVAGDEGVRVLRL